MKDALIGMLSSKKGLVMLACGLMILMTPIAAKVGYEIDEKQLLEFLGIAATYLVGQGIADHGKAAAEIHAETAAALTEPKPMDSTAP